MSSFLVTYNRRTGEVHVREFHGEDGRRQALADRVAAERSRESKDIEVVVLSADSLAELQRTHGRYFRTPTELVADYLAENPSVPV